MIKEVDINKVNGSTAIIKGIPCFSIAVMYQHTPMHVSEGAAIK